MNELAVGFDLANGDDASVVVVAKGETTYKIIGCHQYIGTTLVAILLINAAGEWEKQPLPPPPPQLVPIEDYKAREPEVVQRHHSLRPPRLPSILRSLRKCASFHGTYGRAGRVYR